MRIAITGGTGFAGRFIVSEALRSGHDVALLGRHAPATPGALVEFRHYDLTCHDPAAVLAGCDALVHAAFSHAPGRYRGGEGDDPEGFVSSNREGSRRLFEAAAKAGVRRIVFLSSRAVYDGYPPGTVLSEDFAPRPETLYGMVKHDAEQSLAALRQPASVFVSLRVTGIYGAAAAGCWQKWRTHLESFRRGAEIAPGIATEVHGTDLASAVMLVLEGPRASLAYDVMNVSDLVLDRRDLLRLVAELTGWQGALPLAADRSQVSAMTTSRLEALGWRPGGWQKLRATLPEILREMDPPGWLSAAPK